MKGFTATTEFVHNQPLTPKPYRVIADTTKPPDRFAPISGNNNYRSGMILSKDQLKMLKRKYGIKRIINVAEDSLIFQSDPSYPCGGKSVPCEPLWAKDLGLEYFPFYVGHHVNNAQWETIKEALTKGNTLIHCSHGVDRTGGIVAAWRKSTEPHVTDEELMNYTRTFGGQWVTNPAKNERIRQWMLSKTYDPALAKKVHRSIKPIGLIVTGSVAVAVLIGVIIWRSRQ
jgi:hypothetical protein